MPSFPERLHATQNSPRGVSDGLLVEYEDGLVRLRLNRTHRLNTLDRATSNRLEQLCAAIGSATDVRYVVMSAAGPEAFCMGRDRTETERPTSPIDLRAWGLRQRLVVAVNGAIRGAGYELLRGADHVLAAPHAHFIDPPGVGDHTGAWPAAPVSGGAGTTASSSRWSAEDAMRAGLVHDIVPLAHLQARAELVARRESGCNQPLAPAGRRS